MLCGQVGIAGSVTYVLSLPLLVSFLISSHGTGFTSTVMAELTFQKCAKTNLGPSSSSCRVGDYVTMGGRVAVRDHISIVSKVFALRASRVPKLS